jgi:hypothetical protein
VKQGVGVQVKTAGMTVLGEDGEVRASDYLATDSAAIKKLKSELLCVESAIPEQAMSNPGWDRVRWIRKTQVWSCMVRKRIFFFSNSETCMQLPAAVTSCFASCQHSSGSLRRSGHLRYLQACHTLLVLQGNLMRG